MATKKSSRTKTTKKTTSKALKTQGFDYTRFGSLFVAIGIVIALLMFGLFYYMGQAKTHAEIKKLEAFESLATYFVEDRANESAGETTELTDIGLTKDDDIYLDVLRTKYEGHVPTSTRTERIHLQCRNRNTSETCGYAVSYDDWEETTEEYRATYNEYLQLIDRYVEKANNASTEEEKEAIQKEYQEKADKLIKTLKAQ